MKISVLMPTYDCPPEYFVQSVTSVFEQPHQDVELIIKDGDYNLPAIASSREVRDVINRYSERITYIVGPDGPPPEKSGKLGHNGFYEALNTCIKCASGDIYTLLCSDDLRGPKDTLSFVNEEFEKQHAHMMVLYGWCEWITERGNNIVDKRIPEQTFESLLKSYSLVTPSIFWSAPIHAAFGYFNELLPWCADADFWLRCWRYVKTVHAPRILGRYRVWDVSQARENEPALWEESARIQEYHKWRT